MCIPVMNAFEDIHHKKIAQSLRDSIEKELLKIIENKQDTKTLKKKTAKAIKQVLHNYLKPKESEND